MIKKPLAALVLVLVLIVPSFAAPNGTGGAVKIGILSWSGPLGFKKSWEGMEQYLSKKIGRPFMMIPLEFDDILPAVQQGTVDFFTADPSMFVSAKTLYGAEEVLTMKLINADSVGAVIFTRADNDDISQLPDLIGKRFGALHRWSFGGWQMAEKEFRNAGIDPYPFLHTLRFYDKPDAVVRAVLSGQVDAGTVPASILERMARTGDITMREVKIMNQKDLPDFPYACSTALYPGFPLAKTAAVGHTLAHEVANALKALKPGDEILKAARIMGWVDPLDYTDMEVVQSELRGGGYTGQRRH